MCLDERVSACVRFAHHSDINWTEAAVNSKRALPDNENSSCSFTLSLPSPIKMEQKKKKKMILKVTWLHPPLFCHLTKIHHHSTTNSSLSLFPLVCFDENRQLITEENSITCSHVRAYTHSHLQTLREMHIELNYVFEHLRMRTHTGREFYYQSPIGQ